MTDTNVIDRSAMLTSSPTAKILVRVRFFTPPHAGALAATPGNGIESVAYEVKQHSTDILRHNGHCVPQDSSRPTKEPPARSVLEPILHPPVGGMLRVLDLDPVIEATGAIGAIRVLRH